MQSERKNGSGRQDAARAHMAKVWFVLSKRGSSQTQQFLTRSALRLLEGSSDFSALQRLTWAPVVHHMAHGLILSTEAKATEFAHLWKKSTNILKCTLLSQQDYLNCTPRAWARGPTQKFASTNGLEMASPPMCVCISSTPFPAPDTSSPGHKIS